MVTMYYNTSDLAETFYDFMMSRSDEELIDFNESDMSIAEYVFYYLQEDFQEYCKAFEINVVYR